MKISVLLFIVIITVVLFWNYRNPHLPKEYYTINVGMTRDEAYKILHMKCSGSGHVSFMGIQEPYEWWKSKRNAIILIDFNAGNNWDDYQLRKNDVVTDIKFDSTLEFWWTPLPHFRKQTK